MGNGFDRDDFEEIEKSFADFVEHSGVGQGETCVICGKEKPFCQEFYCDECKEWGNYGKT